MSMRNLFTTLLVLAVMLPTSGASGIGNHSASATDCLSCHANQFDKFDNHFVESNTDCVFCHDRSDDGLTITTITSDEICQVCHVTNSHAVETGAHSGISCMECHDAHSSDNDHLFRTVETSLCTGSCHGSHNLGVSHPQGVSIADDNTGSALSCVSTCHSMHKPAEPKMLQMAALDLCAQCHGDKF